jgi:hypothetical protein
VASSHRGAQQRGLTGTVASDQRDDLAARECEAGVEHDLRFSVER